MVLRTGGNPALKVRSPLKEAGCHGKHKKRASWGFASRLRGDHKSREAQRPKSLRLNGRGGIRTHGTLLTYTHFPGVRLKPLGHPSNVAMYPPADV